MAAAQEAERFCETCYTDVTDRNKSIQCNRGHLFCGDCFGVYAKTTIYEGGDIKYNLRCCAGKCDAIFPRNDLMRVMSRRMFDHYLKRLEDDTISLALVNIPGLARCPHCPYAGILTDVNQKNFPCPHCNKDSCKTCGGKWKVHEGLTCFQYTLKCRTKVKCRQSFEERLSEVKIRKCPTCGLKLVKSEGCNHITCSKCGTHMCYICRQIIKGFSHFSNSTCLPYQNADEDERMAMEEIKKEGKQRMLEHGGRGEIGAPDNI